jgi:hypothetical protein
MLATLGQGFTGLGTIVAIVHPGIGAEWAGPDTERREWWLRLRYYTGTALIVLGTAMQMAG